VFRPGCHGVRSDSHTAADDLDEHVEREDLGIFPVSVVTLGATGWAIVDNAHTRSPSLLLDPATSVPTTHVRPAAAVPIAHEEHACRKSP
jgi:hypothetical protein